MMIVMIDRMVRRQQKHTTENALSADNQQATLLEQGSPQRLCAEYPFNERKKISVSEAILLGILYTDGCLSRKGKNGWRFYLGNRSFKIICEFSRCMMKLFHLDSRKVRITKELLHKHAYYKAIVDSRACGEYLFHKYGTFRTLAKTALDGKKIFPSARLPVDVLKSDIRVLSSFLSTAFSCDSGVNLYVARSKSKYRFLIRNVYLSCRHPKLQLDYVTLLSHLGIFSKILKSDGKVMIQGANKLKHFQQKIGFMDGVKVTQHSVFWSGMDKNSVLERAIASYGNPQSIFALAQFTKG